MLNSMQMFHKKADHVFNEWILVWTDIDENFNIKKKSLEIAWFTI